MSSQKGKAWLWPDTTNEDSAKQAARQGVYACAWIAGVTAFMAFFKLMTFDETSFIDAFIFAAIGFGIYRFSRTAAIAGLLLYILERIYIMVPIRI